MSPQDDGQNPEVVGDARRARALPARVSEQPGGRLPAQTGESREQRVTEGLGELPGGGPALCQPHHQAEVRFYVFLILFYFFNLI